MAGFLLLLQSPRAHLCPACPWLYILNPFSLCEELPSPQLRPWSVQEQGADWRKGRQGAVIFAILIFIIQPGEVHSWDLQTVGQIMP